MPATNVRETILEAVKTKLLTLTEANGYQNDIRKVVRFAVPLEQIADNEFPAVCVLDDGQETNLNEWGGQAGDTTVRADIDLKLVGYYQDTNPETLSTGFNKFKADMDKLWWTNNPPNPNTPAVLPNTQADDVQLTGYDAIYTLEDRGIVIFQANLRIRYWFLKTNP